MDKNNVVDTLFKFNYKNNKDAELIIKEIEKVREEWEMARNFFDTVRDKNLIDYAIYREKAARSKYLYLLNLAKDNGIKISDEYLIS